MAYCLRLPPDAVALIDEMRRHWVDLPGLRVAGGTPSARCLKAFEITPYGDGGNSTVTAKDCNRDHVRCLDFDIANPCLQCRVALKYAETTLCGRCRNRPLVMKMSTRDVDFSMMQHWDWLIV